ncbi:MAG TPA: glycosyltransferase family 4 protein [Chthoniobacterales bacterium]|nr:glycosyltransferase family 4 protein [Chthoniobacterales bacterium]
MREVAYLLERFPSFGQTFCYREVAELERQGTKVHVYSIRRPVDEPKQDWDDQLVRRVHYLPDEDALVREVDRSLRDGKVSGATRETVEKWGRQSDFLRLYQAIYVGMRMQQNGVPHLHAHFAGMAARTAFWLNQFFGIPYSFTAHANDIFAPRDFVVSLAKLMENAAAIVTVSDYAAEFLRNRFREAAAKVHRIHNGVDPSRFHPVDFGSGIPAIVSIGRLIEKKGFADLISACCLLKPRGRPFICEIIGEGPLEAALQSQIVSEGVESCVKLVGPQTQSQIALRLAHATIFALPCTREEGGGMDNLPTVILEAMAAGLPVVSTPIAGVPEMIEHDASGILVPEHEPGAVCAAIEYLIANPEVARRFGDRGRQIAREKFSIETSVRTLRAVFENIQGAAV